MAAEAKRKGLKYHFGYILCICVENNSELPDGHPDNSYKGRAVFQGNQVVDENWEVAMFQDLGSSPANMDASRSADCYGCAPGHDVQLADAEQAYIQAGLKGTQTWVSLPRDAQTDAMKLMRRPVCMLKRPCMATQIAEASGKNTVTSMSAVRAGSLLALTGRRVTSTRS